MSTFKLVSSDSHIMEPPDLWLERIDPAFKDRAPRVRREGEFDQWYADGDIKFGVVGSNTQAGRRFTAPETIRAEGRYEDVLPGGYDPHAHIKDLEFDGVSGDFLYASTTAGFYGLDDSAFVRSAFKAYNDWLADFCKPFPGKLNGIGIVQMQQRFSCPLLTRPPHPLGGLRALLRS